MEEPKPKLQVIVSTINARFLALERVTQIQHPDLCYLIVHQHYNHQDKEDVLELKEKLIKRPDIRIIEATGVGLSKSRNICIDNATSEIVLIADDDIEFCGDFVTSVLNTFDRDSCDVATFVARTPNGYPFKKYKTSCHSHNMISILGVSSIEIAFRTSAIKALQIRFDERFGLGSLYQSSEEAIFLSDCLRNDIDLKFFPLTITIHDSQSTGLNWANPAMAFSKGAVFKRIFGIVGIFPLIGFSLLKWNEYRNHHSLNTFIKENLRSFFNLPGNNI